MKEEEKKPCACAEAHLPQNENKHSPTPASPHAYRGNEDRAFRCSRSGNEAGRDSRTRHQRRPARDTIQGRHVHCRQASPSDGRGPTDGIATESASRQRRDAETRGSYKRHCARRKGRGVKRKTLGMAADVPEGNRAREQDGLKGETPRTTDLWMGQWAPQTRGEHTSCVIVWEGRGTAPRDE